MFDLACIRMGEGQTRRRVIDRVKAGGDATCSPRRSERNPPFWLSLEGSELEPSENCPESIFKSRFGCYTDSGHRLGMNFNS